MCSPLYISICKSLFAHIVVSMTDASEKYNQKSIEFNIHFSLFSYNIWIQFNYIYFGSEYSCVCCKRKILTQLNSRLSSCNHKWKNIERGKRYQTQPKYNIEMNKMDANRSCICKYLLILRPTDMHLENNFDYKYVTEKCPTKKKYYIFFISKYFFFSVRVIILSWW